MQALTARLPRAGRGRGKPAASRRSRDRHDLRCAQRGGAGIQRQGRWHGAARARLTVHHQPPSNATHWRDGHVLAGVDHL